MTRRDMPKGNLLMFYGPSVVAGCICGVIANVDKPLLMDAFFIA